MDKFENINFNNELIKEYSKFEKHIKNSMKPTSCYFCGKKVTRFCNSHSKPQFIIKNIADNGYLLNSFTLLNLPADDFAKKGVKNADTFWLICNDCDNLEFNTYENPDSYVTPPSNTMMKEIALKNYLYRIYKLLYNVELAKQGDILTGTMWHNQQSDKSRLANYKNKFKTIKEGAEFKVIYFKTLDYIVPIATQEVFSPLPNSIENLHICIFPLKTYSVIIMFKNKKEIELNKFIESFEKLNKKQKLSIINYIIFAFTDNFLFNPKISNEVIDELKKVANSDSDIIDFNSDIIDFSICDTIPNLLLDIYCIE